MELLGLSLVGAGASAQNLLSLTGIQKLDNQLNLIKSKIFEILTYNLRYAFDMLQKKQQQGVPYLEKIKGVLPFLLHTAHTFATHPAIDELMHNQIVVDFVI